MPAPKLCTIHCTSIQLRTHRHTHAQTHTCCLNLSLGDCLGDCSSSVESEYSLSLSFIPSEADDEMEVSKRGRDSLLIRRDAYWSDSWRKGCVTKTAESADEVNVLEDDLCKVRQVRLNMESSSDMNSPFLAPQLAVASLL